jgi:hypothetical protein
MMLLNGHAAARAPHDARDLKSLRSQIVLRPKAGSSNSWFGASSPDVCCVGNLGSETRFDYSVIGVTTVQAPRRLGSQGLMNWYGGGRKHHGAGAPLSRPSGRRGPKPSDRISSATTP